MISRDSLIYGFTYVGSSELYIDVYDSSIAGIINRLDNDDYAKDSLRDFINQYDINGFRIKNIFLVGNTRKYYLRDAPEKFRKYIKQYDSYKFFSESFDSDYLLDIYFKDYPNETYNIYYYKKVNSDTFEFVKRLSLFKENTHNKMKTAFDIKSGKVYCSIRNERPFNKTIDDELKKLMDKISELFKGMKEDYSFYYVKTFSQTQHHAYNFIRTQRKFFISTEIRPK